MTPIPDADPPEKLNDDSCDAEVSALSGHRCNILIAEDDPSNQKALSYIMKRLGYRADIVSNGLEALYALEHQEYDIVLMDLAMPVMDGIIATREIRKRFPAAKQPVIIAFSAYITSDSREICIGAGMDDYLAKPAAMNELADLLNKHTNHRPGQS